MPGFSLGRSSESGSTLGLSRSVCSSLGCSCAMSSFRLGLPLTNSRPAWATSSRDGLPDMPVDLTRLAQPAETRILVVLDSLGVWSRAKGHSQ